MKRDEKPAPGTDEAKIPSEAASGDRNLQAELHERERVQEQLYWLVDKLENRLAECEAKASDAEAKLAKETAKRKKAQREAALLKDESERRKNSIEIVNAELDAFSYSISHDLRAPLRHLDGFSTALSEDFGDKLDPAAKGYLDCIGRAARKLELLIESLLSLSRVTRQELSVSTVDLSRIAQQCAASLSEGAPERRVTFVIAEKLTAQADPQMMKVALEQLLGNAWKFTADKEAAVIEFGKTREGGTDLFFVRDNGAGFDMRFADRLFGPFQRMHREGEFEGVGIGLATVQRIIHKHGGRIRAEAEVDRGATFFFSLGGRK